MGRFFGPILGAVFVISIPEFLRYFRELLSLTLNDAQIAIAQRIIYALILLLFLKLQPGGLIDAGKTALAAIQKLSVRIPAIRKGSP
jgi:ABC-type branched-subunit amino acid transport system permease subunit